MGPSRPREHPSDMPSIDITRHHSRPLAEARQKVERVAKHIADKFQVVYEWQGNTLHFSRAGVDGQIAVTTKLIKVTANLGFLLSMIRDPVEREINRYLDEEFS
jgi:putative polyhydroxyalkanoate system protein